MNRVSLVARYLLGFLFTVIGLNGFFHFLPMPPPANPLALQYLTVVTASHYMVLIFHLQLIAGLLLLANRFVPLALTLLAAVLWLLTFSAYRTNFRPILSSKHQPVTF